jgi:molybdopterin synthase catalytic subunit
MAHRKIKRILDELGTAHPCTAVSVIHRHGTVLVGESAVFVGISARHRREAFDMLFSFMDRLKNDVPIWKAEVLK